MIQHRQAKFREKNGDVENKIPDASGLVNTAVLNTEVGKVENKIPDVSSLVKNSLRR